jgi:hypothetical protein
MDTHNIHLGEWKYAGRANDGRAIYDYGDPSNPSSYKIYLNSDNKTGTLYRAGKEVGSGTIGSYNASDPPGGGSQGNSGVGVGASDSRDIAGLKKNHGMTAAAGDPPAKLSLKDRLFGKKKPASPPVKVDFSPAGQLAAFKKSGAYQTTKDSGHDTSKLARQEMVFSYGGQTNVTKNVFMDGSVTYEKNGHILGREPAGSESVAAAPSATGANPGTATTVAASSSGTSTTPGTRAVAPHASDHHGPVGTSLDWKTVKADGNVIVSRDDNAKTTMWHYRDGSIYEQVDGQSKYRASGPTGEATPVKKDDEPLHGAALKGNTGGLGGDGKDVAPTPSWNTSGIAKDLGGIGGKDITDHGNALADRDSKDGTKIVVQMSDGTYESVDKKTGDVAGAGTWGDGKGGGTAVNGVSASGYTPPPTAADWHANPNWTVTSDADKAVLAKVAPSVNAADVLEVRAGENDNTLLRMSDGTYKSVNMAGGTVTEAGTWNKDEWAASTYSSEKNTSSTPTEALARGLPGHTPTEAVDGTPTTVATSNDTAATTPAPAATITMAPTTPAAVAAAAAAATPAPAPTPAAPPSDAVSRYLANNTPAATTSSTPDLSRAYQGGAKPVSVKELKNGGVLTTTASGAVVETTAEGNSYTVKKAPPTPITLPGSSNMDHLGLTGFDTGGSADTSNIHHPGRMIEM